MRLRHGFTAVRVNWGTTWQQRPLLFHNVNGKLELVPAVEGTSLAKLGVGRGMAFGDLFLEDVRQYRIGQLSGTGIEPLFPLWGSAADTPALARRMLAAGLRAVLTCVDPKQLAESFVGRWYDAALLAELPPEVDPCGERGEFHTFCTGGPMFAAEIAVRVGEISCHDGFCFADVLAD